MGVLKGKCPRYCSYVSIGLGVVVLILAGVVGWVVVPNVIEGRVKDETRLVEESDIYEKWVDIPIPLYLNAYFFEITNVEDYKDQNNWGITPKFKEVGPFVWKETRKKYDIRQGPDDTLFYRENISYVFQPEMSGPGLTEKTLLHVVNIPFIAAVTLLDVHDIVRPFAVPTLKSLVSNATGDTGESPMSSVVDVTAGDLMFNGVQLHTVYRSVETVANLLGVPLPFELKDGKFAVFRDKNNTNYEGEFSVYRGDADSEKFAIIKSINNGKRNLKHWWKDDCAMINGTDGTMFPPFIKKEDTLYMYAPEICRSVSLVYDSDVEYEGIPGYKFVLTKDIFDTQDKYPLNECFCPDVKVPLVQDCPKNGMGRLLSCKADVPIAISKPHFLDAGGDVEMNARIWGLSPVRERHEAYVEVEPYTGFPLRGHKRLQLGIEMQPYRSFNMAPFDSIPYVTYPLLWVDESAELDEALVDEIKDKLIKPLALVKVLKWTMIGVGAFMVLAGGLYVGLTWNRG